MKWYIFVIFLVTGLSVAGLLIISLNIDPYKADNQIKSLFFISLFMALWGLSTLILNKFKIRIDWPDFYKSFKIGFVVSLTVFAVYVAVSYIK